MTARPIGRLPRRTMAAIGCCLLGTLTPAAAAEEQPTPPVVQMLVPGFTVDELPVRLTNLNNIEYLGDGSLVAGGYDGRFHLLRDTDGDGLEDRVDTFSPETSSNYPLGVAVRDDVPHFVLSDEVIRFVDRDGDGIPETRETVAKGFEDPSLKDAPYLMHRRVDSAMALAMAPDGSIYVTIGNAAPLNPYWQAAALPDGTPGPRYTADTRLGCLLRITPDGRSEQVASGLRYVMALEFNRHGDLFASDQEGATWCPNGNPFDELLHLEPGRHYGFPPRHPRLLPDVIDEPSLFDYGPQHQSTCGFRFNGPAPGRGRFGPEFWADDAIVTGESRGKLWRTTLANTKAGYVASTQLIGSATMLPVDCAISPRGELTVCCHSGPPDWGSGPNGEGRLFKIRTLDAPPPQPVGVWPASITETAVAFDRPLDVSAWHDVDRAISIEAGRHVGAADRLESLRPGYEVTTIQQRQPRRSVAVRGTRLSADHRCLFVETEPRDSNHVYALQLPHGIDLAHDLSGFAAHWRGDSGEWQGWLPHPDLSAARQFLRGSVDHDALWERLRTAGTLRLRGRLDLGKMLIPETQPGARLDWTPEPEVVTVELRSDGALSVIAEDCAVERLNPHAVQLTWDGPRSGVWPALEVDIGTPAQELDVAWHTSRDPRPRALPRRRVLVPFAVPAPPDAVNREVPELAGADPRAGRELFLGKAACGSCHQFRTGGVQVGPALDNQWHRTYSSVLRDIVEPNATLNPDAIGYTLLLVDGTSLQGTRLAETPDTITIAMPGGTTRVVPKTDIDESVPMSVSLMPTGIDKLLSSTELRDLMAYLLSDPSTMPQ